MLLVAVHGCWLGFSTLLHVQSYQEHSHSKSPFFHMSSTASTCQQACPIKPLLPSWPSSVSPPVRLNQSPLLACVSLGLMATPMVPQPDPRLHSPSSLPACRSLDLFTPAFVAQKGVRKIFSVCTADYDYQSGIFAGVDLFTCSGELPVRFPPS